MLKFKKTKWAGFKFTPEQKEARRMWEEANKREYELRDFLTTATSMANRKNAHEKLDRYLDGIDRTRQRAKELFPEVGESNDTHVATVRIKNVK